MTNPILRNVKTGVLLEDVISRWSCWTRCSMIFHKALNILECNAPSPVLQFPFQLRFQKITRNPKGLRLQRDQIPTESGRGQCHLEHPFFLTPKPECGENRGPLDFCTENHPSGNDRILSFRGATTWIWWFSTCPQVGYVIVPFTEVVVIRSKASEFYGVF